MLELGCGRGHAARLLAAAYPASEVVGVHLSTDAVDEGGVLLMIDSGAPPTLAEQAELPWAPMMYGVSIGHCLTVSLAQGGEGLGALWGREAALDALDAAAFTSVETHDLPGDPMDLLYVARP